MHKLEERELVGVTLEEMLPQIPGWILESVSLLTLLRSNELLPAQAPEPRDRVTCTGNCPFLFGAEDTRTEG